MTRRGFFKKMMAVAAMFGLPASRSKANALQANWPPSFHPFADTEGKEPLWDMTYPDGHIWLHRQCQLYEDGFDEYLIKGSADRQPRSSGIEGLLAKIPPCPDGYSREIIEYSESLFGRPGFADYTFTVVDRQIVRRSRRRLANTEPVAVWVANYA